MNSTEEYFKFAEQFMNDALELSKKKNADYASAGKDMWGNFSAVETFGIPAEIGFITRMTDKLMRISSFVKNGELQVKDESITDTLQDLMNYSVLFAGYLHSLKTKNK